MGSKVRDDNEAETVGHLLVEIPTLLGQVPPRELVNQKNLKLFEKISETRFRFEVQIVTVPIGSSNRSLFAEPRFLNLVRRQVDEGTEDDTKRCDWWMDY